MSQVQKSKKNGNWFFLIVVLAAAIICAVTASVGWFGYRYIVNRQQSQETLTDEEAITQEFERFNEDGRSAMVELNIEGQWAVGDIHPVDPTTGKLIDAGPGIAIFKKINGKWTVIQGSDKNYNQVLDEVPETLMSHEVKRYFRRNQ